MPQISKPAEGKSAGKLRYINGTRTPDSIAQTFPAFHQETGNFSAFRSSIIANPYCGKATAKKSKIGSESKKIWLPALPVSQFAFSLKKSREDLLTPGWTSFSLTFSAEIAVSATKANKGLQMKSETISDIRERLASVDGATKPYRPEHVAKAFGLCTQTIYRAIRAGELPATKFKRKIEITPEGVLKWRKTCAASN